MIWASRRLRDPIAALAIAVVASALILAPPLNRFRGLSIDILTWLRWRADIGTRHTGQSPTVVVALDEETYRTSPFVGTPAITWTPELARVLTAIIAGGAKVVGFDIVFPTSIEQSEIPFGDGMLGARLRGFDRDFLRALALGAHEGKVVLGEAQHRDFPIMPSPGQRIAVGQSANIRSLNVYNDPDDVVRRVPLSVVIDGERQPSIAAELAGRALSALAATISGSRLPSQIPNRMTLNFDSDADSIPTYSLADLRACIEKGDSEFFRRNFVDKVVLIATVLDVEDRQVTSKRFATTPENPTGLRCALPAPPPSTAFARDSTPGVYTHPTAVNNLIRGNALVEIGPLGRGAIAFVFAAITAAATLTFPLLAAVPAYLAAALLWTFGAAQIDRSDATARLNQFKRNYEFFNAPVALFIAIDRRLGPGQWADLGGYIHALMYLARGYRLDTCAQESWARLHGIVGPFVNMPPEQMLFCAVSIGYGDHSHAANSFRSPRAEPEEFCRFFGFQ